MTKDANELFDGQPVLEFESDADRRGFLKYAALFGVGATLVACGNNKSGGGSPAASSSPSTAPSASPTDDTSAFGQGDLGIANFALTLEYLEADFYAKGVAGGSGLLGDLLPLIQPIANHEAAHVQALTQLITAAGGKPAAKPTTKYPDGTFTDKMKFLMTASVFEETGVKAYHGQVTRIQDKKVLAAAASIAGVESRHAAILADILNQKQVPSPVEAHAPSSEIVAAVKPFLGS